MFLTFYGLWQLVVSDRLTIFHIEDFKEEVSRSGKKQWTSSKIRIESWGIGLESMRLDPQESCWFCQWLVALYRIVIIVVKAQIPTLATGSGDGAGSKPMSCEKPSPPPVRHCASTYRHSFVDRADTAQKFATTCDNWEHTWYIMNYNITIQQCAQQLRSIKPRIYYVIWSYYDVSWWTLMNIDEP